MEIDCKIIMKQIGPIAGIGCENTMTEINYAKGIHHQSITKITMKGSITMHFRTTEMGENIKIIVKTSIGMKISMIMIDPLIWMIHKVEIGHMTETGHIVETGTTSKNTKDKSYIRDKLYDTNSYSRDRLWIYCRDVSKEENHKYKRRSRNYYADIYEDRHGRDEYKHQYRDDKYDKIRERLKEKHCSCSYRSCGSFYSELEELYSGTIAVDVQDIPYFTVEVDVQDLHNLPTKVIDELVDPHLSDQDRENSLNLRHETKKGRVRPYENKKESQEAQKVDKELNYMPPPKLPYILNANGKVIGILENIVPKNRPLPKPPPSILHRE